MLIDDIRNFLDIEETVGPLAVFFCAYISSGSIWNCMQEAPFVGEDGIYTIIEVSMFFQTILESYIVVVLKLLFVIGIILLTESGARLNESIDTKMIVLGLFLAVAAYSILQVLFNVKVSTGF